MKVWVDHMVDHFSTYIYQKRGFYYFSRRVPKEVQPLHGKQRIVLALNTRSRAKALKASGLSYSYIADVLKVPGLFQIWL